MIFGKIVLDNGTKYGKAMYYLVINDLIDVDDIDSKSMKNSDLDKKNNMVKDIIEVDRDTVQGNINSSINFNIIIDRLHRA